MNEESNVVRILERHKRIIITCYVLYTIAKIVAIIISLSITGSVAKYGIDLFLVIYSAIDGYEILFFFILGIYKYCANIPLSFSMTRGIQLILEVARLALVTIMAIEISRNLHLLDKAPGIVGLVLVNIEYAKAICFIIFIAANFKNIRRSYIHNLNSEPGIFEATEKLEPHTKIIGKEYSCPICLEMIRLNSVCVVLPCDHAYHHTCLKNWIIIRCICPMCRTAI
ncbi:unnamed protein product [Blepharisma stoltei]|uniref:RING-type domain-containing protein n=1 Tax=Blepharisma stoltei TaxID=1481888 RepID=A0AAU9ITH4_9CILI|nr:unnamed protein product [Blepharisma stoltei]